MDVQGRHLQHDDHVLVERPVVGALILALVALIPATARAQMSVEVSPLRVESKVAAGASASFTETVTLVNHDKAAIRVRATVQDWYLSRDGTPQFNLPTGTMPYSAASWVRLNPTEQTLSGDGGTGAVRFTATVPEGTAPASYRAAIMFEFSPPGAEVVNKGVMIRSRVATVVYITVGSGAPALELTDLQGRELGTLPPAVVATLKNTSRFHARTKGQVVVRNKAGAEIRRLQVPDVPVLPQSERELAISLATEGQPPLPPGEYRVEVRIDVGLPALLVGETTITVSR